jgi:SAM-dependent methyltransferase
MAAAIIRIVIGALLRSAFRGYERWRALGAADAAGEGAGVDEGLPLPPAALRMRVAGTADVAWFLEGGRRAMRCLTAALAAHGARPEDFRAVLDFGCGAGRVLRHARVFRNARLCGADCDASQIAWCREHLGFAEFLVNGLAPPLGAADAAFDLVYAFSVFTHLDAAQQFAWRDEFFRVLAPGGWLMLSTHGDRSAERLPGHLRGRYAAGEMVVRFANVAGSNLCNSYHPPAWVRRHLSGPFALRSFAAEGALGNPHQDLWVLQKPAG